MHALTTKAILAAPKFSGWPEPAVHTKGGARTLQSTARSVDAYEYTATTRPEVRRTARSVYTADRFEVTSDRCVALATPGDRAPP